MTAQWIHLESSMLNMRVLYSPAKISVVYQPALPNPDEFTEYHRVEVR